MSLTNEVTIAPNAEAMMTPTARSTTLPRSKNSLRSFNIFINSFPNFLIYYILNCDKKQLERSKWSVVPFKNIDFTENIV